LVTRTLRRPEGAMCGSMASLGRPGARTVPTTSAVASSCSAPTTPKAPPATGGHKRVRVCRPHPSNAARPPIPSHRPAEKFGRPSCQYRTRSPTATTPTPPLLAARPGAARPRRIVVYVFPRSAADHRRDTNLASDAGQRPPVTCRCTCRWPSPRHRHVTGPVGGTVAVEHSHHWRPGRQPWQQPRCSAGRSEGPIVLGACRSRRRSGPGTVPRPGRADPGDCR
jgi:hypothetical protein